MTSRSDSLRIRLHKTFDRYRTINLLKKKQVALILIELIFVDFIIKKRIQTDRQTLLDLVIESRWHWHPLGTEPKKLIKCNVYELIQLFCFVTAD